MEKIFSIGFQDSCTPFMEGIVDLHNYIFFYLILVLVFVSWMFARIIKDFFITLRRPGHPQYLSSYRKALLFTRETVHGTLLEIIWTITPSFILILIAIPSFGLLYAMDEVLDPALTFKAIGHQWYWSYEFSDHYSYSFDDKGNVSVSENDLIFDSNMVFEDELKLGEARLLTTDTPVILPCDTHIRVIITAQDVLHSWAVPSFGVKVDAVPGRLNQAFVFIKREGIFYGQCSELCGVNHGFMPITIKAISHDSYISWINDKLN